MGLFDFLEPSFLSFLYMLDISHLSDLRLLKILSQSVVGIFVLLIVSFALQKLCNFMNSHLSILDLIVQTIAILFMHFPLCPYLWGFPPLYPLNIRVSGFMWRCLIHLDLSFVQGYKDGSIHILLQPPIVPAPFVENAVFFPLDGFSSLVKDQVTISVWVHFWVFNSIPLIHLSVTWPVPCSFYHNCSVVQL